jgi:glycerol-3-phosphate acyltransferase PlsY
MPLITTVLTLLASYLLGAIPFGLIIVRLKTGKDIRKVESGRTGGTNAGRAAGFWAGALTAVLDFLKSGVSVLLVRFWPEPMIPFTG